MRRLAGIVTLTISVAACAARTTVMPPAPVAPTHPDFPYPVVPGETDSIQATRIERGWRYLQSNNLRSAEREFEAALKLQPSFHPAETALGYLELARRDADDAIARFDRALATTADYVPALRGRGQALLQLGRDADALAAFEAALAADPTLTDLQSRIEVLRVRALQDSIARARAASTAGRLDEARTAYQQALAASPESAFLHRGLAEVERKAGDTARALEHYRRAAALDPSDAQSLAAIGEILETQGDPEAALGVYEEALAIDPSAVPAGAVDRLREMAALAKLPVEYRAIAATTAVTRGDVAALIGVRLAPLLATAPQRQAVITDTRGHWAQPWISPVVRSGIMDTQPNYTFQPGSQVRRGDLAHTVSRALGLIAAQNPAAAAPWQDARVAIADVPPGHLSYPAVSQAVASGVMPLAEDGTFQLLRPVTGAEATAVVSRLESIASQR